jgi:raffinose/stachyose/melibiose transport system substrate-binding protein
MRRMEMKRLIVVGLLVFATVIPVIAAGGTEGTEQKTIELFISGKSVWGEPINTVIEKFSEQYPNISVEVEVVGGGVDYQPVLAGRARTNTLPDVFMINGLGDYVIYQEFLDDLSDMDVVDHMLPNVAEASYHEGKLMGLPVSIEGYGYIYNKKLAERAGIAKVPETFSELEAAVNKLQAAGITPFCSGYNTWWVMSNHQFNIPFAMQDDPLGFIQGLNEGTETMVGNEYFEDLEQLIQLVKNNTANPPLTEDHRMQVSLFASEKVAMIQQGNWKEAAILDANPNIEMGLVPLAISDDPAKSGSIAVGIPWFWVVTADSPEREEARTFLNWLNNEPSGQDQLVTTLNSIPAYDHFDAEFAGGISRDVLAYSARGKALPWIFTLWPAGYQQNVSDILQEYVAERITYAEALQRLDEEYKSLVK